MGLSWPKLHSHTPSAWADFSATSTVVFIPWWSFWALRRYGERPLLSQGYVCLLSLHLLRTSSSSCFNGWFGKGTGLEHDGLNNPPMLPGVMMLTEAHRTEQVWFHGSACHVFAAWHHTLSPSHTCRLEARRKCWCRREGNKLRSLLQRHPDTYPGLCCALCMHSLKQLGSLITGWCTSLPKPIRKCVVNTRAKCESLFGALWASSCWERSSPPLCALSATRSPWKGWRMPFLLCLVTFLAQKTNSQSLSVPPLEMRCVRGFLSTLVMELVGASQLPAFPRRMEPITSPPLKALHCFQSAVIYLLYQPCLQQLSVTMTTILTLLISLLWATENVIFLREEAAFLSRSSTT